MTKPKERAMAVGFLIGVKIAVELGYSKKAILSTIENLINRSANNAT